MNYSGEVYYKVRWQLLQSATSVITKCDRYYKVRRFYYKVRQVIQSVTIITKCYRHSPRCINGYIHLPAIIMGVNLAMANIPSKDKRKAFRDVDQLDNTVDLFFFTLSTADPNISNSLDSKFPLFQGEAEFPLIYPTLFSVIYYQLFRTDPCFRLELKSNENQPRYFEPLTLDKQNTSKHK